jgi:hypothetical protein
VALALQTGMLAASARDPVVSHKALAQAFGVKVGLYVGHVQLSRSVRVSTTSRRHTRHSDSHVKSERELLQTPGREFVILVARSGCTQPSYRLFEQNASSQAINAFSRVIRLLIRVFPIFQESMLIVRSIVFSSGDIREARSSRRSNFVECVGVVGMARFLGNGFRVQSAWIS